MLKYLVSEVEGNNLRLTIQLHTDQIKIVGKSESLLVAGERVFSLLKKVSLSQNGSKCGLWYAAIAILLDVDVFFLALQRKAIAPTTITSLNCGLLVRSYRRFA